LLLNAGYEYVYFDGLNRYYVAGEHQDLKGAFKVPPNVFDDFVRSDRLELERRTQEAEAKVKEVEQRASQAEARAQEAETRVQQAEERAAQAEESEGVKTQLAKASARQSGQRAAQAEARAQEAEIKARKTEERAVQAEEHVAQAEATLQRVFNSRSWRVMQPLRRLAGTARLLRDKAKRLLKRLVARVLLPSIRFARSHQWLKSVVLRGLGKYPRLESRLRRFDTARSLNGASFNKCSNGSVHGSSMAGPQELMDLSPRAREIYHQLKVASEKDSAE
jgi:hypothetical protein